ncbi:glycosyltransferase family 2 protein [Pseudoclavibacter chungangensis]|uniref:Glycosyltransferase family 2 protein n=1 Tax=Pseudoclavibacter chungangensis TaxID=587635 RepID=A0A7J5C221_9MICO|nr:glycosyltransferase family 2 protein [Pseudoclavibacter chungangensis]KAB1662555.1 glycosyltransferase family 2 protein [Pseudoclavibacter chungangensis]
MGDSAERGRRPAASTCDGTGRTGRQYTADVQFDVLPFVVWGLILLVSANSVLWVTSSVVRWVTGVPRRLSGLGERRRARIPTREDVAVLVAAHNEELGIARTVRSAHEHVPRGNVFVASDGSTDATAAIARAVGANVLEVTPNRGKAGALSYAIDHFDLASRFEVVMLLDADTVLSPDYLDTGLPLFARDEVVAVAGTARTAWDPGPSSWLGELLVTHRERMYLVMQFLMKFGQASRFANAVNIVPGFASMYRTRILSQVDIAAPGLVIEDFNMTFEVQAKELGTIAFDPRAARAYTQDPDSLPAYTKQVRRWSLGFWQTLKRHASLPLRFRAFLSLYIVELTFTSLVIVAMPALILLSLVVGFEAVHGPSPLESFAATVPALGLLLGYFAADLFVTIVAFSIDHRPQFLRWVLLLPAVRWLDAVLCLQAAVLSLRGRADGRWQSPTRR